MSTIKTFTTKPLNLSSTSLYPRNYDPVYMFVKNFLKDFTNLEDSLVDSIKGGSTPPYYLFYPNYEKGIPFVKTSAILRHFININDLYNINEKFHKKTIKRSITKPYDVIFSMTGKFMGKAALCPNVFEEINMSQNSVVLKTDSPLKSAFIATFLNSNINQTQIKGKYSITKQKYLNQGKIAKLKILDYKKEYDRILEDYINGVEDYYNGIKKIQLIIDSFNSEINIQRDFLDKAVFFSTKQQSITKTILLPSYYRNDFNSCIKEFQNQFESNRVFDTNRITKGNEIGSDNYLFEGIPFVKTSDITNFDVDYEPNYYCSEAIFNELSQEIKRGDIIFTKDGKRGEVALIQENANIVISSGFLKYRPINEIDRYWCFLLLASNFGKIYFDKWFVIASTMAHLRKDFFKDFKIPMIDSKRELYVKKLQEAFIQKDKGFTALNISKSNLLDKIYSEYNISK